MESRSLVLFVLLSLCGSSISYANKPSDLSQAIFCEGCVATVAEILKKLQKKTGENREIKVVDAMEDICNLQNFGKYQYSPPKTGQACKYLIDHYDEDIENTFIYQTEGFEQKICYEISQACEGVDRSVKEKEDLEVNINDRKQPLQSGKDSGPESFNVNINEEGAADRLINEINRSIKEKNKNKINEEEGEDEDDDSDTEEGSENLTDDVEKEKTEL